MSDLAIRRNSTHGSHQFIPVSSHCVDEPLGSCTWKALDAPCPSLQDFDPWHHRRFPQLEMVGSATATYQKASVIEEGDPLTTVC